MRLFWFACVLYILPLSLLGAAWKSAIEVWRDEQELRQSGWRTLCLRVALGIAGVATIASAAFLYSWFYNGGSPHGLLPSPGLWKVLGPVSFWSLIATVVLGFAGKGKGRLLLLVWAPAVLFVEAIFFVLEMD